MTEFNPTKNTILYGYRGSIAHNMFIPPEEECSTDDVDLMGISISPPEYYLGLKSFEQKQVSMGKDDIIIYDIRKFFKLLVKGNPNVLSFIWNDPKMFIPSGECCRDELGLRIIMNKEIFSSKQAFNSFHGYAYSQLKKMDHGKVYEGYMGAKRKAIVDKFGYDIKNAAHMIRLLRMGIEFLTEQRMTVYREKDRNELIAIKQGKLTLSDIREMADGLFEDLKAAEKKSTLPEKPDIGKIESLLMWIMRDYFGTDENKYREI